MIAPDSEWQSAPHTLIVYSVEPPMGRWDDGHLECEIVHPASCGSVERWRDGTYEFFERAKHCFVDYCLDSGDIEFMLNYSHTPITKPGTYLIEAWGTKIYYWDMGYEYDSGIRVIGQGSVQRLLTVAA